uniref:Transient receptor potential cation channel subfamily M member 7 n=1 Tax=Leptobrachium leishanense TaxID=445787 RepID=A0A8C5MGG0_9ANUR
MKKMQLYDTFIITAQCAFKKGFDSKEDLINKQKIFCIVLNPSGLAQGSSLLQDSGPWTVERHTEKIPTDAYGTILFQGGSQGYKAKFVRLSNDSKIEDIIHLMIKYWRMKLPKLLISIHGGTQKFEIQHSLKEALSRGFIKAAESSEAWIITDGISNGVTTHIRDAIKEEAFRLSHTVCTIGIAPWGVVEGRSDLVGRNVVAPYQSLKNPLSKLHVLNRHHSHFLLVDDGTVGKYGGEIHIRTELEKGVRQQLIHTRTGTHIPIVAVVIEGGPSIIYTVLDYLQQSPPVPVVVCEGSGRAADLLAYTEPLEQAMLDALIMNRVAFVKLLIENGVSVHKFLTIARLEELNTTLLHLIQDVKKGTLPAGYKITLMDVGLVVELLMGGTFRCNYTKKHFRMSDFGPQRSEPKKSTGIAENEDNTIKPFPYPFNDLLIWAVLTNRQSMALFLWQHGEDFLAKALVARKLYLSMYHEVRRNDIVDDTWQNLKANSKAFGKLALDLLDKAYKQNETMAMKLLTCELSNWSRFTCLKLAVFGRLRTFVGHTCTQSLLSDIWMGRLNLRKNSWYKVPASSIHLGQYYKVEGLQENLTHVRTERKHFPSLRTFYAFYHAPIVKFWFNTFAYLGFLMLYSYVVLTEMKSMPSVQEWIVISVIFTTGLEKIYEIILSEAGKLTHKWKMWFHSYMNINDTFGLITDPYENPMFITGRIIYCLNIIFWFVRLLDFLNVNQEAGPYVLMMGKMITKMFSLLVIMAIVILAFGVPRRGILYPREKPSWYTLKEVVFRPYWMTFGEVFAYEIDGMSSCANESVVPYLCGPGTWLLPFLQGVYLIFEYILLVNLLIALFNNVYMQGKEMSDVLWKFQRYHFVMLYQHKPVLPPPLSFISYFTSLMRWIFVQRKKNRLNGTSKRAKLYLTQEEQKTLHDFEERCVVMYFNDKKDFDSSNSEERIRVTNERVEQMGDRMKDVGDHVSIIKHSLRCLDYHIGHLQDLSGLTYDALSTLTAQKALESSRSHSIISCDLSLSRQTSDDGIERSAVGRTGRNHHVWSRSLSHPGLEKVHNSRVTKSQRKFLSDTSPVHSALLQKVVSLEEFQHGTVCEDENSSIHSHKLMSLKNRPTPGVAQTYLQNPAHNQKRPDINAAKSSLGRYTVNQNVTSSSEPASTICLDLPETDKNCGYVNSGFIDDTGHDIDFYENGSKYSESILKPFMKQSHGTLIQMQGHQETLIETSTRDADSLPKRHKRDGSSEQGTDKVNPFVQGKKHTGAAQRFLRKSTTTGNNYFIFFSVCSEFERTLALLSTKVIGGSSIGTVPYQDLVIKD